MRKDWVLTIGIDKYYLTEKQTKFYLSSIDKGAKYVAVDENKMLGTNFQSLVHVSVKEETRQLDSGRWQCEKGRWHNKGAECFCGQTFEKSGDKYLITGDE